MMMAASADALAQRGGAMGHGVGAPMGGTGSSMGGGYGAGTPGGMQRDGAPVGRMDRGQGAGADRQAPEQRQGKTPQELLQQNTRLADNLSKLLPAGTNLQAAASGFGNLGEFVAAVHVSNNLGIPFADLKTRMAAGDSLGSAIQALKPDTDAQVEVRKARARAEDERARS